MNIIVGISGGIAAYKACDLIYGLQANKNEVRVIMTENAKEFITPLTLATISKNPVMTDMWAERSSGVLMLLPVHLGMRLLQIIFTHLIGCSKLKDMAHLNC